ncbi:MAG: hypothetical protein ACJ780_17640, partial [Solirubrobacteraceae bacterium]
MAPGVLELTVATRVTPWFVVGGVWEKAVTEVLLGTSDAGVGTGTGTGAGAGADRGTMRAVGAELAGADLPTPFAAVTATAIVLPTSAATGV